MTPRSLIVDGLGAARVRQSALILLATLVSLNSPVFGGSPGSTTAELLKIPIGARAIGMGEAYTAAADDSSSLEWNPAGLAQATQREASFMHSSLIENVNYEHLAYISPGTSYSAGASMSYLGYGSIAGYDNGGASIGNQSAYGYVFNGGLASRFFDRVSAGLTGSFLHQKLAMDSASTLAANAGAIYEVQAHPLRTDYRLGFSALNMGPGLKFVSDRAPLPRQFKFGAAALHVNTWPLNLTADLGVPNDNSAYVSFGSEYWFHELVALRLGYTGANTTSNGLRAGIGLKIHQILFDYAYGSFGDFGSTHRLELAMRFGERTRQLNGEERAILKEARVHIKEGDYKQGILGLNALLDRDPENQNVLKQMVEANEAMLRKDLKEKEVDTASDKNAGIPSPEEFALQDLVPGQQAAMAKPGALPMVNPGDDPLGLEGLPDANHLSDPNALGLALHPLLESAVGSTPAAVGPAHEATLPKTIEAPAASEKPPKPASHVKDVGAPVVPTLAPDSKQTPAATPSQTREVGAPVVPTPAPESSSKVERVSATQEVGAPVTPEPASSGSSANESAPEPTTPSVVAPTPAPTPANTSSGDNTLVNPNDIYSN